MASTTRTVIFGAILVACSARPDFRPGDQCELNSECRTPLVCRLGHCRLECRAERDCAAGLHCVRDSDGLGACQLEQERECQHASDCVTPLVCRFGNCTNACETDRDCPPGASCEADTEGNRGCRDVSEMECTLNSQCAPLYICAVDGRCREECRGDRDCRDGLVCRWDMSPSVCGSPDGRPDAALPDGGLSDGGMPTLPPAPPLLSAGLEHTCGALASGELRCWGRNRYGQLGDSSLMDRDRAVTTGLTGVNLVGAGANHTCAATATALYCWGSDASGQVGIGAGGNVQAPNMVSGLPAVPSSLALGSDHTCAIADDRLFCWGANDNGQLGDGSFTPRSAPTEITTSNIPVQVSAFSNQTCVRFNDGTVSCMGDNTLGQLGDGTMNRRNTPTPIPGLGGVVQIACGTTHTCALLGSGAVTCWGDDFAGQIGNGPGGPAQVTSPTPPLTLPAQARQLALGSTHSCARTASGVYCWGENRNGQCGQDYTVGLPGERFESPTAIAGFGPVDEIGAGTNHTCARTTATFYCFGSNTFGQLGTGSMSETFMPTMVLWP